MEAGREPAPVNRANSVNFRESRESGRLGGGTLAEFELLFVDFQGLDPGLEGRWWNSKLTRCAGRSGNPASSLSERRLDNLPLASRLNIQKPATFQPELPCGEVLLESHNSSTEKTSVARSA